MKFLLSILSLLIVGIHVSTAQGVLNFEQETHEFETVIEGNMATHEFTFTNDGDQPIIISNVRASCGCTTPFWTKEPVLPGQKGKIKASYNSKGRPGVFNKTITITSNATEPSKRLTIKGNVVKEEVKPQYSDDELTASPKIVFDTKVYNLGKIELGQSVAKKISFTNSGNSPLMIKDLQSTCNCVSVLRSPEEIAPGKKGEIEINFTPRMAAKKNEIVYFFSNDITQPKASIQFAVEVVNDLAGGSIMQSNDNSNPFK